MSHPIGIITVGNESRRSFSVPQHGYVTGYSIKLTPSRGGWDIALILESTVGPNFPRKVSVIKVWNGRVRTTSPDCPYYQALREAHELRAKLDPSIQKKASGHAAEAFLAWRKRKAADDV